MSQKGEKNKTTEGYFLGEKLFSSILSDEEDLSILSEEDIKVKAFACKTSKINTQWSQAMEELKKDFENQVGEREKTRKRNESDGRIS